MCRRERSRRPTDVQTGVSIRVKTSNFFQKNQGLKQISEMANRAQKVQKVMVQPINLIFRYLQTRARVDIWLYENINMQGSIVGFDEYMNIVLDDAEEVYVKTQTRKQIGRVLLKGDNITLIQNAVVPQQ